VFAKLNQDRPIRWMLDQAIKETSTRVDAIKR